MIPLIIMLLLPLTFAIAYVWGSYASDNDIPIILTLTVASVFGLLMAALWTSYFAQ